MSLKKNVLTIFSIFLVIIPLSNADIYTGLKTHYTMDEGSGTKLIDSVNGKNMTFFTGTWTTPKIGANAVTMTQTQNANYTNGELYDNVQHTPLTVNLWRNLSNNLQFNTHDYWFFFRPKSNVSFVLALTNTALPEDNFLWQKTQDGVTSDCILEVPLNSTANLTVGTFQMFTGVYNGTNLLLYLNANKIGQSTACANLDGTQNEPAFLSLHKTDPSQFTGSSAVDEVTIWNRTLNQTEITQLFNSSNGYKLYASPAQPVGESPVPNNSLTNQLISGWISNATNPLRDIKQVNNLTIQGTPTYITNPSCNPFSTCLNLTEDDSDYLEKTSPVDFPTGNSRRTDICWIRSESSLYGGYDGFFGYGTAGVGNAYGFGASGTSYYEAGFGYDYAFGTVDVGNMMMITRVYDGQDDLIYFNTTLAQNTSRPLYNTIPSTFIVGASLFNSADDLIGFVGNCYIWNRTLSQTEITQIYANETNGCYGDDGWNCTTTPPPTPQPSVSSCFTPDNTIGCDESAVWTCNTANTTSATFQVNNANFTGAQINNTAFTYIRTHTDTANVSETLTLQQVTALNANGTNTLNTNIPIQHNCTFTPPTGFQPEFQSTDTTKAVFDLIAGVLIGLASVATLWGLAIGFDKLIQYMPFLKFKP